MHKKDNTVLEKLFSHPMTMNLEWSEVKHMLESLGAEVETTHHSHVKIRLNGEVQTFTTLGHKTISDKDELNALKHFLEKAGCAPKV